MTKIYFQKMCQITFFGNRKLRHLLLNSDYDAVNKNVDEFGDFLSYFQKVCQITFFGNRNRNRGGFRCRRVG